MLEAENDFVFTIVCEQLGFVGVMALLSVYFLLIWRGFCIARNTRDYFGSVLVCGIMTMFSLHIILNLLVVTDLVPNTGISFPFISSGGSFSLVQFMQMGIVLSVSKTSTIDKRRLFRRKPKLTVVNGGGEQ